LSRKAITAMRIERGVARSPCSLCTEQFRHIRLGAAWLAGIEHLRRPEPHQVRRLRLRIRLRNRELNALILCDWATEDHSLITIPHRSLNKPARIPNGLRRNENPLGVHTV